MIDLPQLFNDTAINNYDLGRSSSSSSSDDPSSDSNNTSRELHTISEDHYISSISLDAGDNNIEKPLQSRDQLVSKDHYKSIIEILIKYPELGKTFKSSYNIPPTRPSVIIYQAANSNASEVDFTYVIESLTFGLVPSWAKPTDPEPVQRDGKPGPPYSKELQRYEGRQFNCRKESMGKGNALPTWNSHKRRTRCVVPILGYYEWLKQKNDKIPHFVHSKNTSIIYLAGLYSHNKNYKMNDGDEYFSSFSIVTGPASKENDIKDMSWLHSRKPIILNPGSKEWFDWLDPEKDWDDSILDTILDTQKTTAFNDIEGYVVGKSIGKTVSEGKELIEKCNSVNSSPQKLIMLFFSSTMKKPQIKRVQFESNNLLSPTKRVKREKNDIFSALKNVKKEGVQSKNMGSENFIKREEEN